MFLSIVKTFADKNVLFVSVAAVDDTDDGGDGDGVEHAHLPPAPGLHTWPASQVDTDMAHAGHKKMFALYCTHICQRNNKGETLIHQSNLGQSFGHRIKTICCQMFKFFVFSKKNSSKIVTPWYNSPKLLSSVNDCADYQ